jgi:hypothetical protein
MSSSRGPTAASAGDFIAASFADPDPDTDPFGGFFISFISFLANTLSSLRALLSLPSQTQERRPSLLPQLPVFGFPMSF